MGKVARTSPAPNELPAYISTVALPSAFVTAVFIGRSPISVSKVTIVGLEIPVTVAVNFPGESVLMV